jgi:hypothetical protein
MRIGRWRPGYPVSSSRQATRFRCVVRVLFELVASTAQQAFGLQHVNEGSVAYHSLDAEQPATGGPARIGLLILVLGRALARP